MKRLSAVVLTVGFLAMAVSPALGEVYVGLDHLAPPEIYDNLGGPVLQEAGQTFLATFDLFIGVRLFIGDPDSEFPSLGPLVGPADLVLYDATDLGSPIELARNRVVEVGEELIGVFDLFLNCPVETVSGQRYFFSIAAEDNFGLGLRKPTSSTYPDGVEAFLIAGIIQEHPDSRDVSFRIWAETDFDLDGDGFPVCEGDCDDLNAEVNPIATELPGNLVDENCDGSLGACDPTAEWRNHGQFVRCVSHECEDLVELGLLTTEECDLLVSLAARTDVGKK